MRTRNTLQLTAIQGALEAAGRPLSPEEVLKDAKKKVPSLGIATVYRTLKLLIQQKVLVAQDIPTSGVRYELAKLAHHHHFLCKHCDKVFDIPGCVGDLKKILPKGFKLEEHDILLKGLCRECN